MVSRFNIYHFKPTVEEWLIWAQDKGLDSRVTGFIDNNRDYLDGDMLRVLDSGLEKTPDRRAWERVSALLENIEAVNDTAKKAVAGIVGAKAAARFFESFSERRVLSAKEVLQDFESVKQLASQYRIAELSVLNASIFRYLDRLPDGEFSDTLRSNLSAYIRWMTESDRREAMAQFCNLMENVRYAHANLLMMQQAPEVYQSINQFILSL